MKANWKTLNKLLNRCKKPISDHFCINNSLNYDPNIISGEFNEYFVRHPRDICESIPDSRENYMNLIPTNETTMYFNPTSSEEVFRVLKNMRKQGAQIY